MKKKLVKYLVPVICVIVVLGVVLFFINPIAPLFLLVSIIIQVPIVWLLISNAYDNAYRARNEKRKEEFEASGNAQNWLVKEEEEEASFGYMFLSQSTKTLGKLNKAELLLTLGRQSEALPSIQLIDAKKMDKTQKERYLKILNKANDFAEN